MTYAVVIVSAVTFVWWLIGSLLNRRRGAELVRAIRAELPKLGGNATIRWFGGSGFQIDVAKLDRGMARLQVVGLLEARDLPLVWFYKRFSGQRDRLVVQADFQRPPRRLGAESEAGLASGPEDSPRPLLPGLLRLRLQSESPHLFLSLQVPPGQEAVIGQAFHLIDDVANGKASILKA